MINVITLQINSTNNIDISQWDWLKMIRDYTGDDSIITINSYDNYIIRSTISPEDYEYLKNGDNYE